MPQEKPARGHGSHEEPRGARDGVSLRGVALFAVEGADASGEQGESGPPATIPLVPAGDLVRARDGRMFTAEDPEAIVSATLAEFPDGIPLDQDHEIEYFGGPASGWIVPFVSDDGSIRGRVDYTQRGHDAVASREFRFISPAVTLEFADDETTVPAIGMLTSAALTNRPALRMSALNSRENTDMREIKIIREMLGLDADADVVAGVRVALSKLAETQAAPAETGDVVPRADLLMMQERAERAEAELSKREADAFAAEVSAVLDEAVKSGRIAPASRDFYAATATDADGLARLREEMGKRSASPLTQEIVTGSPDDSGAFTERDRQVMQALGLSEDRYRETRDALRSESRN